MQNSDPSNVIPAELVAAPLPRINSVDATSGQPMVDRVLARKLELEALLAALPADDRRIRLEIDQALTTINGLLTGDLAKIPAVVVADMNRWLERSKHVAETPNAPEAAAAPKPNNVPTIA
jgi:hypothetical protein